MSDESVDPLAAPVVCAGCGDTSDVLPLGWSTQTSTRGAEVLCDRCTRANVRSIEAKLDEAWW